MRPFAVLALNVIVGSVGFWVGGFAGGCLIAAMVVADCMAVVAEGRAWAREDAADASSLPSETFKASPPSYRADQITEGNPSLVYDWETTCQHTGITRLVCSRGYCGAWARGREGRAG